MQTPPIISSASLTYTPADHHSSAPASQPPQNPQAGTADSQAQEQESAHTPNETPPGLKQDLIALHQASAAHPQQPLAQRSQQGLESKKVPNTLSPDPMTKLQQKHQAQLQEIALQQEALEQKIETLGLHVKQVQIQKQLIQLLQSEENYPPTGLDQMQLQKFWTQKLLQLNSGGQISLPHQDSLKLRVQYERALQKLDLQELQLLKPLELEAREALFQELFSELEKVAQAETSQLELQLLEVKISLQQLNYMHLMELQHLSPQRQKDAIELIQSILRKEQERAPERRRFFE